MAMENKRIIQLNTERTTPAADDYVMVDSATAGTAKYPLPKITDAIDQEIRDRTSADTALQTAITNEATARTNADTTLQGNITAEATARAAADTAINAELATKADADAPIATADQLMSDVFTADQVPYLFRPSGGDGADREIDQIVGGSIVWNQLCNGSSVTVLNGHKYYMLKGGTASIGASTGSAITGLTSGTDMVTDLTQAFGSTIADYIYSLEQATAGVGVAWFKQFFSEDYYPYDAGTMKHVEGLSAHVMRDASENVIGNYPLDSTLTLRGIPKLDSNNQLYYDGDTYAADGTVTRKYGIYTFTGNEGWAVYTAWGSDHTFVCSNVLPLASAENNVLTSLYPTLSQPEVMGGTGTGIWFRGDNKNLYVSDTSLTSASDARAKFKAGTNIIYELATPTTEEAEPYNEVQIVDDFGTEEYVTTSIVPVGHYTKYPANLRSAIERVMEQVPEAPSANGTYVLKATKTSNGVTYAWVAE